jgi:regulator of sigma E protease
MQQPSIVMTVLAFGLLLGPLVMLHELGHYLVGRWCGVRVVAFSIGFGREIAGWTDRHGTRWKLSLLPLGGYVQFAGDMGATSASVDKIPLDIKEREGWFHFKPLWQRFLIVLAGPLTNLIVAVAIFAGFNATYGRVYAPAVVAGFAPQSPAQAAGLRVGDKIVAIAGDRIDGFDEIRSHVVPFPGEKVPVEIERAGQHLSLTLTIGERKLRDQFGNEQKIGMLGVAGAGLRRVHLGPVESLTTAVSQTYGVMGTMVTAACASWAGRSKSPNFPASNWRWAGSNLSISRLSSQLIWHSSTCCQSQPWTAGIWLFTLPRPSVANPWAIAARNGLCERAWRLFWV